PGTAPRGGGDRARMHEHGPLRCRIAAPSRHPGLRHRELRDLVPSGCAAAPFRSAMITLYTFGPAFGLPDPSPFVMKAEMLLKLAKLPYRTDTGVFRRPPKGKLPHIDDEGTAVADSTLIRLHLGRTHGIDSAAGLTPSERGIA